MAQRGGLLAKWERRADDYGLTQIDIEAARLAQGLLLGARAVCTDVLGQHGEAVLVEVLRIMQAYGGAQTGEWAPRPVEH